MEAYISTFVNPDGVGPFPTADSILGSAWIRRQVAIGSKPIPAPRKGFSASMLGQLHARRGHPVISEIIEVGEGRRGRLLHMSLLDTGLEELRRFGDLAPLAARLRQTDEYEKAEYEVLAAAAYARHGCSIAPNFGGRGPDFEVTSNSGVSAWVECKRKDTVTQLEQKMRRYRSRVDADLISTLQKNQLSFHVNFHVLEDPSAVDPKELMQATVDLCRARDWGSETFGSSLRIQVVKLAEPGATVPEEILNLFMSERLAMRTSQVSVRDGAVEPQNRQNPVQVQWVVPTDTAGRAKGIENSLREAASQLPRSGPGIVYIDLNASEYSEAQNGLDRVNRDISRLLSGQYRRINYVVVTAIFSTSTSDGVEGWSFNVILFKQRNPRAELPGGIPVLGATPHFERSWFDGEWLHDRYSAVPDNLPVLAVPIPRSRKLSD